MGKTKGIRRIIASQKLTYFIPAIFLAITLLLGLQLKKLEVNNKLEEFLPENDEVAEFTKRINEKFNSNLVVFSVIEADDVFRTDFLRKLKNVADEIKKISEVENVVSILNATYIEKTEDGLEVKGAIDKIPETEEELSRLRKRIMSNSRFAGVFVSKNSKYTNIFIYLYHNADATKSVEKIREVLEKQKVKFYLGGIPANIYYMNMFMRRDFAVLLPTSAVFMFLVLLIFLGSKRYAFLTIFTISLGIIWMFGFTATLGLPISMVSSIAPVILLSTGTAYSIHLISRFITEYKKISDENSGGTGRKAEAVVEALREVGLPILLSALTTVVGFLSFATSGFRPITNLGITLSGGIISALLISTVLIPALLISIGKENIGKEPKSKKPESGDMENPQQKKKIGNKTTKTKKISGEKISEILDVFMEWNSKVVWKHGSKILILWVIASFLLAAAVRKVKVEMNFEEFFPEESQPRKASQIIKQNFSGTIPAYFWFKGDVKSPVLLEEMMRAKFYLFSFDEVGEPQSVADLIRELNEKMYGYSWIPDSRRKVSNLWIFIDGEPMLKQMVLENHKEAMLISQYREQKSTKIIELAEYMKKFEGKRKFLLLRRSALSTEELREVNEIFAETRAELMRAAVLSYLGLKVDIPQNIFGVELNPDEQFIDEIRKYVQSDESEIYLEDEREIELLLQSIKEDISELKKKENWIWEKPKWEKTKEFLISSPQKNRYSTDDIEDFLGSISRIFYNVKIAVFSNLVYEKVRKILESQSDIKGDIPENLESFLKGIAGSYITALVWIPEDMASEDLKEKSKIISFEVKSAGSPPLHKRIQKIMVDGQIKSIGVALLAVFLMLLVQMRSFLSAFISVLPIVLAIFMYFGIMGLFGIPLDNGTLMISGVAIGAGIDYSIHMIHRLKREIALTKEHRNFEEAYRNILKNVFSSTGKSIFANAFSVSAGFLILLLSELVIIKRFGFVTALVMILTSAGAVFLIPTLAKIFGLVEKFRKEKEEPENLEIKATQGGKKS